MDKNSKIYIAGHTGLVGSAFVRKLEAEGYSNLVYKDIDELDLRNQDDVEKFFMAEKPEYVFLAAAKVGGILANSTYKAEFIYDNIMIAANVINAAYKTGVKKLINLGSSCIYPKHAPQPMKEEYLLTGKLEPTNEPYAIAKIAAIKLCRYYNEQYGTDFISVMPTNLYGPEDNFNLETAHVLPAIIRKLHLAKLLSEGEMAAIRKDITKRPLGFGLEKDLDLNDDMSIASMLEKIGLTGESATFWGSGEPFREFLYVDDMADACVFLMEKYNSSDIGEFVNIGVGKDINIRELTEIIREIIGFNGDLKYDKSRPDGTLKKQLEISKMKELGWSPKIDLKTGIKMVYEWYLDPRV
ncbi:GDP-L-fucose synthase family protein [Elusimicrobiota bacterium]